MHDDAPKQPGPPEPVVVGGYRIERLIGAGGMAEVYEARRLGRTSPGEPVACKVMHAAGQAEPIARLLMRREAVLGMRFAAGHPNLVQVLDAFDVAPSVHGADGTDRTKVRRCIVMELVDGASVAELRGPDRRLPPPVVRRIACEALEALVYLHGMGVLHRDLSPRNILVTAGGALKIADLGLAREMEQGTVHTMTFRGTPAYASPEAVLMRPCDGRADLFSLATILYELVAGTPPTGTVEHAGSIVARIITGHFAPLPEDAPSDLAELILGLLPIDPGERWAQTATQALDFLRRQDQPVASSEELAALVAPARERRQAEIEYAPPAGALPPGHVLVPDDLVTGRPRTIAPRWRLGALARLVTGRAALVAGIAVGLLACVAVLAFVLRDRPDDVRDAAETPQPRELPAPIAGPVDESLGDPGPSPVAPVTPSSVTPEPAEAPARSEKTNETAGSRRNAERVAGPHRKRTGSQRRPRPTRAAPPRWTAEPLGDEPPAWGTP